MPEDNHRVEPGPEQLRQIWRTHIERWKQCGQTQVAYCRDHGLKPNQFTYWKKKFGQTDADISFVPLRFSRNLPVAVTGSTFNLFTQNGFKIEVDARFDPATLKHQRSFDPGRAGHVAYKPFSGDLFVFCNRQRTIIKILYWDHNGFCLWYKRLEKYKFKWPNSRQDVMTIAAKQLSWLLAGLDFTSAHQRLTHSVVA